MPVLKPDEILRYLTAKSFLSVAESELVSSRWNVDQHGPLLQYLGREKLLPEDVVEDLLTLIGNNQLEGLEPQLPGLILLHMVGKGGRGQVYRAWQPSLRRVVAVKILSRALSANREYIQRFLREARVASKVQHRNIVRAFDINKKGTDVYMVMEYVAGTSLGTVLRERGKLPPAEGLEIALKVADAIAYIAKVGLVHRDIKPDNVMIDRRGRVKLCDLGLARPHGGSNLTGPLVAQGTPAYMSPENAIGRDLDAQADVYSLGVMLYRALLGKLPFDNPDPVELLRMHVEEQPRGLDGGELPGAFSELIRKMLAKDPKQRPDAKDLPRELLALQKSLPGMDRARVYELVPGGEPTALSAADDELAIEEPGAALQPVPNAAPMYKPWEDPALAQRPARTSRGYRVNGLGIGAMGFALFCALLYIIVMTISDAPEIKDDPRIKELQTRVTELEKESGDARKDLSSMTGSLELASQRLKLENEEDLRRKSREPRRDAPEDVMREIIAMRDSARLKNLAGGK